MTSSADPLAAWLKRDTLLKALPESELARLESVLSRVAHAKGRAIYNELEGPGHLWILKTGRVRLVRYSSSGRAFAFQVVTPGQAFCIPAIMNGCPYPCRAIADTQVVLLKLPAAAFQRLLGRYPAFGYEALKLVSRSCCQAHALCSASQERVEQRLAAALIQLLEAFGPDIPLGRQQLAELVGVSRETANRILLTLQKQGVIRLSFQRMTIRDPAKLRVRMGQDL